MKSSAFRAAIAATALVAGSLSAQCWTGGGPVALTIQGQVPSAADPVGHTVDVSNNPWSLALADTTGGYPFILAGGASIACGAIPVPWGGSIDLAGAYVIIDGINPAGGFDFFAVSNFNVTLPPLTTLPVATVGPALQAVYLDPANPPFNLNNTQAGQPVTNSRVTVYSTVGDDVALNHSLLVPITYAGISYTSCFIGSNGMVTFTTGSTDFTPTPAEFANGFRAAATTGVNPGVAVLWSDWFRSTVTNDEIRVTENFVSGAVTVAYNNVQHYGSQTPAGSFSGTFAGAGPDSFVVDLSGVIASGVTTDQPKVFGVTDGTNVAGGVDTNNTFSALLALGGGTYTSAVGPESIMESMVSNVLPSVALATYVHLGGYTWLLY